MFAQRFLGSPPDKHCNWMAKGCFDVEKKSILARDHGFLLLFCKMGVGNIDTGEMQGFV